MSTDTLVVGASASRGGEGFYRALLAGAPYVIAADAAGEWCVSMGRVPDECVGDFDSAAPGADERLAALGTNVLRVSPSKDESDLDLCVTRASAREGRLCFTAAFSDRVDHTLCSLGAVLRAAALAPVVREPSWTAWTVGGSVGASLSLALPTGVTFSVIALEAATGVSIAGGRYPLENGALAPLSSLGLSNVAAGPVTVTTRTGTLLVIAQARL